MLLDTFWHVFHLVDGHPSADFIMLWESLHDDIPKDPMDEQHELPLSRYQGDRPDASAREQLPKHIFDLSGCCKWSTAMRALSLLHCVCNLPYIALCITTTRIT
jgi:hypothetical protein